MEIGFTTGCLYKSNTSFDDRIIIYNFFSPTAIELGFSSPSSLLEYSPSSKMINLIKKNNIITIHAPWKEIKYGFNIETEKVVEGLKNLCEIFPVKGIVMHPDKISSFSRLEGPGLPFLLENMDKRKKTGTHPEHFRKYAEDYGFNFVLDVQHSYEHDPSMKLTKELLEVMGSRLHHMHVSGSNDLENHVPVHQAKNKKEITDILELRIKTPKILEGIITKEILQTLQNELNFIRSYENQ